MIAAVGGLGIVGMPGVVATAGRATAATPGGTSPITGSWAALPDGTVIDFGNAPNLGSAANLNQPVIGIAAASDRGGYWLVATDGGAFSYGDASFYGSTGSIHLNQPVVGMAATPNGHGYWLVAADGGVFIQPGPSPGLSTNGDCLDPHLGKGLSQLSPTCPYERSRSSALISA